MATTSTPSNASCVPSHMSPALCRKWLDTCMTFARESDQIRGVANGRPAIADYELEDPLTAKAFGLLLQWACEDNAGFSATFGPIAWGEECLCPFHSDGLSFISNVVRNGILDDWEIYAKWTDAGYVVVLELESSDADRRFGYEWAPDWLHRRVGGARDPVDLSADIRDALHIRSIELSSHLAVDGPAARRANHLR